MYRLERESFLTYPLMCLWSLAGFQAGFINAFGFLACGRYVSHVTGVGTQIGLALGAHEIPLAVELVGFPLSFILGAAFSGFWTSARMDLNLRPRYDLVTLFLPLALLAASIGGDFGVFGKFGGPITNPADLALLFILSFLCGLQNGCIATITKGQIRTTHLTGISTDIGTDMARMIFGRLSGDERLYVRRANISRIMIFLAFSFGSILSVSASQKLEYLALLMPAMTALTIAVAMAIVAKEMDRRFIKTLRATNDSGRSNHSLPRHATP